MSERRCRNGGDSSDEPQDGVSLQAGGDDRQLDGPVRIPGARGGLGYRRRVPGVPRGRGADGLLDAAQGGHRRPGSGGVRRLGGHPRPVPGDAATHRLRCAHRRARQDGRRLHVHDPVTDGGALLRRERSRSRHVRGSGGGVADHGVGADGGVAAPVPAGPGEPPHPGAADAGRPVGRRVPVLHLPRGRRDRRHPGVHDPARLRPSSASSSGWSDRAARSCGTR